MPPYARRSKRPRSGKAPMALVRKTRKVNYEKTLTLSKPFKKVLEKCLDRRQSNQYKDREIRRTQIPSTMASGMDLQGWLPDIYQVAEEQGIGQDAIAFTSGTRTGKQLRLKTSYCKLCFTIPTDDLEEEEDRACITVCVYLLSSKQFPDLKDVQNNWGSGEELKEKLLDAGGAGTPQGASNEPFTGTVGDELFKINTRDFTVHDKKVFDMKRGQLPGGIDPTENVGGHMPAIKKDITLRWKCKNKVLRYSNSDETQPSNGSPFIFWGFTYSGTGAAPSTAGVPFVYGRIYTTWENMT